MENSRAAERLELRWVSVVDASGRTRLEARWVATDASAPGAHAA